MWNTHSRRKLLCDAWNVDIQTCNISIKDYTYTVTLTGNQEISCTVFNAIIIFTQQTEAGLPSVIQSVAVLLVLLAVQLYTSCSLLNWRKQVFVLHVVKQGVTVPHCETHLAGKSCYVMPEMWTTKPAIFPLWITLTQLQAIKKSVVQFSVPSFFHTTNLITEWSRTSIRDSVSYGTISITSISTNHS